MRAQEQQIVLQQKNVYPYFLDAVITALNKLNIQVFNQETIVYLGYVLTTFVDADKLYPQKEANHRYQEALAEIFLKAHHESGANALASYRRAGDTALYFSGIFPEQFQTRKARVSLAYYGDMGRLAYHHVSVRAHNYALQTLYEELSDQFHTFTRVLYEAIDLQNKHIRATDDPSLSLLKIIH